MPKKKKYAEEKIITYEQPLTTGQKLLIHTICFFAVMFLLVGGFLLKSKSDEQEAASRAAYEASLAADEKAILPTAAPALTEEDIEKLFDSYRPQITEKPQSVEEGQTGDETQGSSGSQVAEEPEENVEPQITMVPQETINICPIDFESLQLLNPDVYAWISVPGTVIEYPILQHATDNTYYLNYNIDGSHGYPGCIYTENLNAKDFSDKNTVIYGHNMKNGTMFAGLHKFRDSTFFEENDKVYIYTPEAMYEYTIFASYIYDDRHLMYSFDFANEDVYETYINDVFERRDLNTNLRSDVEITKEDKIVTLATCIGNMPSNRLLIQAVLVNVSTFE